MTVTASYGNQALLEFVVWTVWPGPVGISFSGAQLQDCDLMHQDFLVTIAREKEANGTGFPCWGSNHGRNGPVITWHPGNKGERNSGGQHGLPFHLNPKGRCGMEMENRFENGGTFKAHSSPEQVEMLPTEPGRAAHRIALNQKGSP